MAMAVLRVAALGLGGVPLSLALAPLAPAAAGAEPLQPRCGGTLLQLQVQRQASSAFDRFRFNLGVEAEAGTAAEALQLLNQRLERVRAVVTPLASGPLTVLAPSSYGIGTGRQRQRASTSLSGEVSKANYDALIQAAGSLPGVSLQGFTALASSASEAQLQSQLLRDALADGRRQAEATAAALGLRRLQLLRIDQRGGGGRPMPLGMVAARSFNPDEAPAPERSLSLALDYCLS